MNWIHLFLFGSYFNLWNTFDIKTHLSISFIDNLIPDQYNKFNTTKYEQKNTSIFYIPRKYNLNNINDESPVSDFNVSLEVLHSYFIYYKLLKLLENDNVSKIQKLQMIDTTEITKEVVTSSYVPDLFKNLYF